MTEQSKQLHLVALHFEDLAARVLGSRERPGFGIGTPSQIEAQIRRYLRSQRGLIRTRRRVEVLRKEHPECDRQYYGIIGAIDWTVDELSESIAMLRARLRGTPQ